MILLHDKLPCSDNFFRYFKNYDNYMEDRNKKKGTDRTTKSPNSTDSEGDYSYLMQKVSKSPVRSIESPKYGLGLSPIHKFIAQNSPCGSPTNLDVNRKFKLSDAAAILK
jgi:hypothetical protein